MTHHRMPTNPCPNCHAALNCNEGVDTDNQPVENDASVCQHCGQICIFTADLTLVPITAEELDREQAGNPENYRILTDLSERFRNARIH